MRTFGAPDGRGAESLFRGGGLGRAKVFYCARSKVSTLHTYSSAAQSILFLRHQQTETAASALATVTGRLELHTAAACPTTALQLSWRPRGSCGSGHPMQSLVDCMLVHLAQQCPVWGRAGSTREMTAASAWASATKHPCVVPCGPLTKSISMGAERGAKGHYQQIGKMASC